MVTGDAETAVLVEFLDAQRAVVLAILAGMDDHALRTAVLPSGWTPLGLVKHLGDAERHWFGEVATGTDLDLDWDEIDDPLADPTGGGPFVTGRTAADVLAYYRDQCERANALLAVTPLSAAPVGTHEWEGVVDDVPDLRWIVLHMIEETARHAGHLDVARELLDGETGLGPR